jgi:hypothetical protein
MMHPAKGRSFRELPARVRVDSIIDNDLRGVLLEHRRSREFKINIERKLTTLACHNGQLQLALSRIALSLGVIRGRADSPGPVNLFKAPAV